MEPVTVQSDIRRVESWEHVDSALGVLRFIEAKISEISVGYDQQIQALQEAKKQSCETLVRRKDRVEALVKEFFTAHKADIKGRKSVKMTHGEVGTRKGNPKILLTYSEEQTIKMLKIRNQTQCVAILEELDKTAVKALPPHELSAIGARIEQKENFYYKLSSDPVVTYPETGPTAADEHDQA